MQQQKSANQNFIGETEYKIPLATTITSVLATEEKSHYRSIYNNN